MPQLVYVTNIQKFCTHDGPGIRTNVFFKGCSMECKWCANPETIDKAEDRQLFKDTMEQIGQPVAINAPAAGGVSPTASTKQSSFIMTEAGWSRSQASVRTAGRVSVRVTRMRGRSSVS